MAAPFYDGALGHREIKYDHFGRRRHYQYSCDVYSLGADHDGADDGVLCTEVLGDFPVFFPEHLQAVSGKPEIFDVD